MPLGKGIPQLLPSSCRDLPSLGTARTRIQSGCWRGSCLEHMEAECHGSAAFTPRPKLLALVAPGLAEDTFGSSNFCQFGWKRRCRAAPRVHVVSVYPNTAPRPQPHPHCASPTELVSKWPELPKDTGKRIQSPPWSPLLSTSHCQIPASHTFIKLVPCAPR